MREIEAVAPAPTSFFTRSKAKEESQADDKEQVRSKCFYLGLLTYGPHVKPLL